MPRRRAGQERRLFIRVSADLDERLRRRAADLQISVSALVRQAVVLFLAAGGNIGSASGTESSPERER